MGRLLESPLVLLFLILVVVSAVVLVVRATAKPKNPAQGYPPQVVNALQPGHPKQTGPGNLPPGYQYPNFDYSQQLKGQSHRTNSFVLGILGLFLFGVILGPLAISQAGKAESLGVPATAGRVLGWIDLIGGLFLVVIFFSNYAG